MMLGLQKTRSTNPGVSLVRHRA